MRLIKSLNHRTRKTKRQGEMERQRVRDLRLSLPDPSTLDDAALHQELWRVLAELSHIKVALFHTDHLSDRELYTLLVSEILQEKTWPTGGRDTKHVIDLMAGSSYKAVKCFLRYYADEPTRSYFANHCPGLELPEQQPLPFERECRLAALRSL